MAAQIGFDHRVRFDVFGCFQILRQLPEMVVLLTAQKSRLQKQQHQRRWPSDDLVSQDVGGE
jgi:hypothetical protein